VVQIAPAVRVAVGEAFGLPAGTNCLDKLVQALKLMGSEEVYDTNFGADLTVIEEANEFLARLENGGPFPMFTSCCPAWIKHLEKENPKYLKNVSTCKSPMEMFGAILKDQYKKKDEEDGMKTFHIAIMPCTAKKMEAKRPEFQKDGVPDVDLVLTTHEIINMIKESGIHFEELDGDSPNLPFGMGTGAAVMFGTTGGVAEAVARYVLEDKSRNALQVLEYSGLRGSDTLRTVALPVGDKVLNIAVVHGLVNAKKLMADIEAGKAHYDLVEVMTCKTGCVGGGGQPHGLMNVKKQRAAGLYDADRVAMIKRSEHNPIAVDLLKQLGERNHELLHVHYGAHEE
jgi:NADH-quinone oxidoreductase subunit G